MSVPEFKELSRAYGFDEVAIAPGEITINPDQTNTEFSITSHTFNFRSNWINLCWYSYSYRSSIAWCIRRISVIFFSEKFNQGVF